MPNKISNIGTITLNNKVIVSDPCYSIDDWCNKIINNMQPGEYECFEVLIDTRFGERIGELHIVHKEVLDKYKELKDIPYSPEPLCCSIGVDSGQCGIFDYEYYDRHQPDDDYDDPESWYKRICDITLDPPCCGTVDNVGVVSESGWGDGMYNLYSYLDTKSTKALKVVFIEENE